MFSLGEGGEKDWAGLVGSCLTSLTGECREDGREGELSRNCSKGGEDRGAEHFTKPVGPLCPFVGFLHFLQAGPEAVALAGSPVASLTPFLGSRVRVCKSSPLRTRGEREGEGAGAGGRADSPSTSVSCSWILPRRLRSSRNREAGPRLLLLCAGAGVTLLGGRGGLRSELPPGDDGRFRIPEPSFS